MPRLWTETVEAHRRAVRVAILETTAALVAEAGLRGVTMSQIAAETGIGRATLYKYFPDVESIVLAWHEQQIDRHLAQLARIREGAGGLDAVLEAYALIVHESRRHADADLTALFHRDDHLAGARRRLHLLLRELIAESGARDDVSADELATYCLHALSAAGALPSRPAVRRLVQVTLAGLRPARERLCD